ncbi:hypothetical protein BKA56DRAFT_584138 [Ilyonectria sp. MPI-CAGE-AT-0026]|nr:hypothetical protein BKA56DRAFT_584138 [Ilyonectria sp. MPI-CAGE-AT-0026]
MEVVLANGTIVTASKTKNTDLFKVLKGGGNNFGIVTSFLLQGYKQGEVYSGNLVFPQSKEIDAKLLKAASDFTKYNSDNKAAIILTASRTSTVDVWAMFIFYDGPVPPAGTFDNFTQVGPISNTIKKQSYADLMIGNNAFVVKGIINTIATETVPLPSAVDASSAEVLGDIHQHWRKITESTLSLANITTVIGYQPFPKRIAQISREKGFDLLDMDDDVDRILIEVNYSYLLPTDTNKIDKTMKETYGGIRDRVLKWQHKGVLKKDAFLPLAMNGGYYSQDYFGRLRPKNHQLAKKVAAKVDPNGLFEDRTGGFKL